MVVLTKRIDDMTKEKSEKGKKEKEKNVEGSTKIRAFMAIAEDEPLVGKADARSNGKVTLDQLLSEQIPGNIVKALGGKGKRKEKISSKEVVFTKADESSSVLAPEITSDSESECDSQEPLPPLPKLIEAVPSGTLESLISLSDLTLNMADLTLDTPVPKKTRASADSSTKQLLLTLMEKVKGLKRKIKIPSSTPPSSSQPSSSKATKQKTWFGPSKHQGFKNHLFDDCYSKPKCSTCGSIDHLTKEHLKHAAVKKTLRLPQEELGPKVVLEMILQETHKGKRKREMKKTHVHPHVYFNKEMEQWVDVEGKERERMRDEEGTVHHSVLNKANAVSEWVDVDLKRKRGKSRAEEEDPRRLGGCLGESSKVLEKVVGLVVLGGCFRYASYGLDLLILVIAWSAFSVTPLKLSSLFVLFVCKKPDETSGSGVVSIDMNDHLYLHSNDTNGTLLISFKLSGTKNYRVWAAALKHCIHSKNKLGFINGKLTKPDPETQPFLAEQLERCNSMVLTWILNFVSPEFFIGQVFSSNAKQMRDELAETSDKIDGSDIFNLHYKINTVSQNEFKLSDYYHKLNSLWREYDVMVQLPICARDGAGSYKDHVQLLKLIQFVMGLDDVYAPIRSTILTTNPLPTVKEAFSLLSRDESHRTMHAGGSGVKGSTSAFNSIPYDNKGNNTSFVPRSDKDIVTGTSTSHTLTSEQYQSLMSLLSDRFWNWCSEQCCRTIAKVNQIGSYKLNDKIVLKDVLVVPGYQVSLLSVHQLAKVNKMLGHPADQVLSVLKDKIDLNGLESSEPCEVCHKAKQTRDPFPLSDHKTSSLGELVQLDVWGPYRVTSREGFKFFLTIVDDFSTAVWLFLLPSSVLSGKCPYELVYKCQSSLSHLSKPYDDERDPSDSGGTKSSPVGPVVESASAYPNSTSDPSASTSESCEKGLSHEPSSSNKLGSIIAEGGTGDDSASLNDDDLISEGEGLDLYKVDLLFHEDSNENRTDEGQSVRRSSRKSILPAKLKDYVVDGKFKYSINTVVNYSSLSCEKNSFTTNLNKTYEPKSYKEAVLDSKWVEAMNNEIETLNRNKTWTIVELPKGRKPIGCKWVWKIKYKSTGEVERYKARLVAKGFGQKEGIDYEETFSPVVKMVTVRCVLTLAVQYDWNVYQLDINNAFLYGELVEDVYMTLPEGYFSSDDKRVCKLQKSLYGQSFVVLLVYVDDILITGNDISDIKMCKDLLSSKFLIKDLRDLKYFLGIELIKNDKGICLSQRKYSLELLSEFGMLDCNPSKTPLYVSKNKNKPVKLVDGDERFLDNITKFQKLVGKLIYLTLTRPDISYVVHRLCQVMHAPRLADMKSAFKVLRYIKSSPGGTGIQFSKTNNIQVTAIVDSDWAKCTATRKSSAEAEYRAMSSVTCEIIWIMKIFTELKVEYKTPIEVFSDNSPAVQIAANPVFHERANHFEVDLFFLREKISQGVIKTVKVKCEDNISDLFTKGLPVADHKKFCDLLHLKDMFQA
ncbi:putative RNA-directed DNA polymerase [Tanacetum coccineum]